MEICETAPVCRAHGEFQIDPLPRFQVQIAEGPFHEIASEPMPPASEEIPEGEIKAVQKSKETRSETTTLRRKFAEMVNKNRKKALNFEQLFQPCQRELVYSADCQSARRMASCPTLLLPAGLGWHSPGFNPDKGAVIFGGQHI
jgi:hypothetical protein